MPVKLLLVILVIMSMTTLAQILPLNRLTQMVLQLGIQLAGILILIMTHMSPGRGTPVLQPCRTLMVR